jgi:hypothetical protein
VQTEGFWPACVCMCVQTVSCARARCLIVRLGKVFEFAEDAGIVLYSFCGFRHFLPRPESRVEWRFCCKLASTP